MNWYKRYPSDFLTGIARMTVGEVGVYQILLDHQWDLGGRLPADEDELLELLPRDVTRERFQSMWERRLCAKFTLDDRGYYNPRLERERLAAEASAIRRSEAARTAAGARWNADRMPDASDSDASRTKNECVEHPTRASREIARLASKDLVSKNLDSVEVPAPLNTEEFSAVWTEWLTYRRRHRWSTRPDWAARQLKMLAAHGPAIAIAALQQSMAQGWQGVFPDKVRREPPPPDGIPVDRTPPPKDPELVGCPVAGCEWRGQLGWRSDHLADSHTPESWRSRHDRPADRLGRRRAARAGR